MNAQRPLIGITCGTVTSPSGVAFYGHRQNYVQALQQAGAAVVLVPPGDSAAALAVLSFVDGLMLPGGSDIDPIQLPGANESSGRHARP